MPAPLLQISDPANAAVDVALNQVVTLTFDQVLDTDSVSSQTVLLRSEEINEVIDTVVALDPAGRIVRVTPVTLMIPESTYKVVVLGADVTTTSIESGGLPLAVSIQITFSTGTQTETSIEEITGDLNLPGEVTTVIGGATPLSIISTKPRHNAFGFPVDQGQFQFRFNKDLDGTSVAANVEIEFEAFYDEGELLAAESDLGLGGDLEHYFKFQTEDYTGGAAGFLDPTLFDFPSSGAWSTSGNYLFYDYTGSLPKNTCVTVILGEELADSDGGFLGDDFVWFACSEPWPDWVSVRAARHEVGSVATKDVPDSFIGLRIWQNSMDLIQQFNWRIDIVEASIYYKKLVRCETSLSIWEDLKMQSALLSGTSKTLGDLKIQYSATSGAVRPFGLTRLQEDCAQLKNQVWYYLTEMPEVGVKSRRDPLEPSRGYFRERLWRAELVYNNVAVPSNVANSALERFQAAGAITAHRAY